MKEDPPSLVSILDKNSPQMLRWIIVWCSDSNIQGRLLLSMKYKITLFLFYKQLNNIALYVQDLRPKTSTKTWTILISTDQRDEL